MGRKKQGEEKHRDRSRACCGMLGMGTAPSTGTWAPSLLGYPKHQGLTCPELLCPKYFFLWLLPGMLAVSLPSSSSLHLLNVLLLSCSWLNIPPSCCNISSTSPLDISVTRSYQHSATNIWDPALKGELLAHLFFFSFSVMSWVTSPPFLSPHSINVSF